MPDVYCLDASCGEKIDPILVAAGHKVHMLCTMPTATLEPNVAPETAAEPDPFADTPRTIDESFAITEMVQETVVDFWQNHPRSLQTRIGPSEIGHPCKRHLAYKLLDWPQVNKGGDPLPSFVGTGAHLMMDQAFTYANEKLGRERYIMNRELTIRPGLTGHGDCFDTDTGTVLDWKFPGTEPMRKYRKNILGDTYRVQLHAYGLGWENAGHTVNAVADVFMSRGGNILGKYGAHTIREPYSRQIVLDALERLDSVLVAADALDVEHNPAMWELIPATPDHCDWCPWFLPRVKDLSAGCPGDTAKEGTTA
jgi:hypothetical protein